MYSFLRSSPNPRLAGSCQEAFANKKTFQSKANQPPACQQVWGTGLELEVPKWTSLDRSGAGGSPSKYVSEGLEEGARIGVGEAHPKRTS